jgi:hypothetical protein
MRRLTIGLLLGIVVATLPPSFAKETKVLAVVLGKQVTMADLKPAADWRKGLDHAHKSFHKPAPTEERVESDSDFDQTQGW